MPSFWTRAIGVVPCFALSFFLLLLLFLPVLPRDGRDCFLFLLRVKPFRCCCCCRGPPKVVVAPGGISSVVVLVVGDDDDAAEHAGGGAPQK